jgi:hypothetical protein
MALWTGRRSDGAYESISVTVRGPKVVVVVTELAPVTTT